MDLGLKRWTDVSGDNECNYCLIYYGQRRRGSVAVGGWEPLSQPHRGNLDDDDEKCSI